MTATGINWISHRGVVERAMENTMQSFRDAVAAGFQTLETDLQATADGVLVLSHDANTGHVSEVALDIPTSTYAEIRAIQTFDGQHILRFEEFVEAFPDQLWILDIKPETANDVVDLLRDWLHANDREKGLFERARFLFWDPKQQEYARRRLPGAVFMARMSECQRAGFFCMLRMPWFAGIVPGKNYSLYPSVKGINLFKPGIIAGYHRYNATVLAYRPENEEQIEQALAAGVDEVILDFPYERMR